MSESFSDEVVSCHNAFIERHIGPNAKQQAHMLSALQLETLDDLTQSALPDCIHLKSNPIVDQPISETEALEQLKAYAKANQTITSCIGQGYYGTHVPAVIQRNVLENPGWYTAYTPYQAEISQGRLEMLLNFQHMVSDLTAMEMANASLLDEASAAAEAMALCKRAGRSKSLRFLVANDVHPQTLDVLTTRARHFGYELVIAEPSSVVSESDYFGIFLQYPNTYGGVSDLTDLITQAHQHGALVVMATDLLALTLLKAPGEMGADIVIGSSQRFGVPIGFGGPHAAFMATRSRFQRTMPGRVIGVSKNTRGEPTLRMAMQTREQHIRREKATSNICTAQALLANMAACYAVYHGPEGLKQIAQRVHQLTSRLAAALSEAGIPITQGHSFDTLTLKTQDKTLTYLDKALKSGFNLRKIDAEHLGISLDETFTLESVQSLAQALIGKPVVLAASPSLIPQALKRRSAYLEHPVFHQYHSETEMLRYLKHLENKDFSLTHGMIPLGSCTMKLNASTEMMPLSWPEFANIHPFAPADQTLGYQALMKDLCRRLEDMTGYDAFSLQPNSGAHGEYAGLLAIQAYHHSRGDTQRNICLIPSSAHGTNPASAAMAGLKIVVIACDDAGNIDLENLRTRVEQYSQQLSCIMITYPSTHGVFEESVRDVCQLIHQHGGQVYLDGANMNAQVGLTSPGFVGADVSHLNLHKTFAIPHGGGGPGVGPIGVKAHLAKFLPGHQFWPQGYQAPQGEAICSAPFGSASILTITWAYVAMMGNHGLKQATEVAILSANYIAHRLAPHYPVLYTNGEGRVAHECIIDIRPLKASSKITEEDIAKRLMDYGFHAPTMSFPVPGTLMIEPTESESLTEIDRFCEALIHIRQEIAQVEQGVWPLDNNPLVNAPHPVSDLIDDWTRPYSRETAVFPVPNLKQRKFWPATHRVDNVYGDRNLFCSCIPVSEYQNED